MYVPLLLARTQLAHGASAASDKVGKARRAQPEARIGRRGREKRKRGGRKSGQGGERGCGPLTWKGPSWQGRPSAASSAIVGQREKRKRGERGEGRN